MSVMSKGVRKKYKRVLLHLLRAFKEDCSKWMLQVKCYDG